MAWQSIRGLEALGGSLLGELDLFYGVAVAYGAALAGVGEDFCAADGDGDVAALEDFGTGGELEELVKGGEVISKSDRLLESFLKRAPDLGATFLAELLQELMDVIHVRASRKYHVHIVLA